MQAFDGVEARLSAYAYLVSLFPEKIVDYLGLTLELKPRKYGSWTPAFTGGRRRELLISNGDGDRNRQAFADLTGSEADYRGYLELGSLQAQLAEVAWPSLTQPLVSRREMRDRLGSDGARA